MQLCWCTSQVPDATNFFLLITFLKTSDACGVFVFLLYGFSWASNKIFFHFLIFSVFIYLSFFCEIFLGVVLWIGKTFEDRDLIEIKINFEMGSWDGHKTWHSPSLNIQCTLNSALSLEVLYLSQHLWSYMNQKRTMKYIYLSQ